MPKKNGFYEQNAIMVDEAEDFVFDNIEDNLEDFVVDEAEAIGPDTQFIVEEEVAPDEDMGMIIPGSDAQYVEEEQAVEEAKTWEKDGDPAAFIQYLQDKLTKIPRHSGETVPGCERAKAFLKSLDSEISKAMRSDLKGEIDEQAVDDHRKSIGDMVERLERQIKKLTGKKKASLDVRLVSEGHCEKCDSTAPMWHDIANDAMVCMACDSQKMKSEDGLEKTATTPAINVYVSAFERAIVGTIINSKVSAGRNIEEVYGKLKDKYNFNPREELAIQQLISDYGYPVYKDRGLLNEPSDPSSGDGLDWLTNYHA